MASEEAQPQFQSRGDASPHLQATRLAGLLCVPIVPTNSSSNSCISPGVAYGGLNTKQKRSKFVSGTKKVPQRTFATKISPNFRVNFLVRFAGAICLKTLDLLDNDR